MNPDKSFRLGNNKHCYMSDLGHIRFNKQSSTITLLRFPMAVLIMLLHSSFEYEMIDGKSIFNGWEAPCYHYLDYIFVKNICSIAVPLFFLVSGFLFFKESYLTIELYKIKVAKRIKSLLVPYLLWNLIVFFLYLIVQLILPSMNSGRNKLIMDYSIEDYFMMFWSMSYIQEGGINGPINSPLWFVRDLMMMVLISPILFWILKKIKILFPVLTLFVYILGFWPVIPGFSIVALAFFTLGAFFAIRQYDFTIMSSKFVMFLSLLYLLMLILVVVMKDVQEIGLVCLKNVLVVIGVFMSIGWATWLSTGNRVTISPFLTGSTFFVFASHCEILKVFIRLSSRVGIKCDFYFCLMYFVCPFLTLILILFIYKCLKSFFPLMASSLSGGR